MILFCGGCRIPVEAVTDSVGLTWEALPSGHASVRLIQGALIPDGALYLCPPCRGEQTRAWPPVISEPAPRRIIPTIVKRHCQAPFCSKLFRARRADARFCSPACRKRAARRRHVS